VNTMDDPRETPTCVIPGCPQRAAEWGQPCPACLDAFGSHLRLSDTAPLTREQIADRDAYVERAYYAQRSTAGVRR